MTSTLCVLSSKNHRQRSFNRWPNEMVEMQTGNLTSKLEQNNSKQPKSMKSSQTSAITFIAIFRWWQSALVTSCIGLPLSPTMHASCRRIAMFFVEAVILANWRNELLSLQRSMLVVVDDVIAERTGHNVKTRRRRKLASNYRTRTASKLELAAAAAKLYNSP